MYSAYQKKIVELFDEETTAKVWAGEKVVEDFEMERTEETPAPFVSDEDPGSGVVPLPSSRNSGGYCKLDARVRFYLDLDDLDTEEEIDLEEVAAAAMRARG